MERCTSLLLSTMSPRSDGSSGYTVRFSWGPGSAKFFSSTKWSRSNRYSWHLWSWAAMTNLKQCRGGLEGRSSGSLSDGLQTYRSQATAVLLFLTSNRGHSVHLTTSSTHILETRQVMLRKQGCTVELSMSQVVMASCACNV